MKCGTKSIRIKHFRCKKHFSIEIIPSILNESFEKSMTQYENTAFILNLCKSKNGLSKNNQFFAFDFQFCIVKSSYSVEFVYVNQFYNHSIKLCWNVIVYMYIFIIIHGFPLNSTHSFRSHFRFFHDGYNQQPDCLFPRLLFFFFSPNFWAMCGSMCFCV